MMKATTLSLAVLLLALVTAPQVPAQLTLVNSGSSPSAPGATIPVFPQTVGTAHTIDNTNVRVGSGSVARTAVAANSSYLPTSIVLDPNTNGGCAGANPGYTLQWWYRPAASTTFQYLWGDGTWLSPVGSNGAFRCFQNGAAGTEHLIVRGPVDPTGGTIGIPTAIVAATSQPPLNAANADPNGWVHFAFVMDWTLGTGTWYVNGAVNNTGPADLTIADTGTNLTIMGYNGSASAGGQGNYDDFRVYNWARSGADISADYFATATGLGPSGCPNTPDDGYFENEIAFNPHTAQVGINTEPNGLETRLFGDGDVINWRVDSTAAGPFLGTAVMNLFGPLVGGAPVPGARQAAYRAVQPVPAPGPFLTPPIPGFQLGHCVSIPPAIAGTGVLAGTFPDSLGLGPLIAVPCGGFTIPQMYTYGSSIVPPPLSASFQIPPGVFADGDRVDIQWLTVDTGYPGGFGLSNRNSFYFVSAQSGPHAHVEARGTSPLQDTGFFEVWNTGTVPIIEVCIDTITAPLPDTWLPATVLNSGGSLSALTSIRAQTDVICDLVNPPGFYLIGTHQLCFEFACPSTNPPNGGFEGPSNHFIFDCDTAARQPGSSFIGALVTVVYCDGTMQGGLMVADPGDPNAAVIDL